MKAFLARLRGVLTLETAAFEEMRDARDGIRRALLLIAVISLIVAFPTFVGEFVQGWRPFDAARARAEAEAALQPLSPALGPMLDNVRAGLNIGLEVAALPPRLPRPLAHTLQALGRYLSSPFAWVGGWLSYLLWVMLAAKLMGGRGGIRQMLATTSLYSIPQALNVLGFVPFLGRALWVVAFTWGLLVYVKAVAVANDFDWSKAALATLAPLIVLAYGLVVVTGLAGLWG